MTREELLALPLRELDATVAEKVMGWVEARVAEYSHRLVGRPNAEAPFADILKYSTDDKAVRLVRNRIAKLGLVDAFVSQLYEMLLPGGRTNEGGVWDATWAIKQATPQQDCIAAFLAWQEKERGE